VVTGTHKHGCHDHGVLKAKASLVNN
jgi:hypothetical protein